MRYAFGDYEFDPHRNGLQHAGEHIKLEPRVSSVLAYLIRYRHRVVTKHELLEQFWPQQHVGDWVLTRCISVARKAIGCSVHTQPWIKTIYGEGYQFSPSVEERDENARILSAIPTNGFGPNDIHQNIVALNPVLFQPTPYHPQLEGERRQATVLSCVLVNGPQLAETLGMEAMHSLKKRFFEFVLRMVRPYEGTIQQFAEAGCIVLFGVPLSHEDHARRAVLAADAIHQGLYDTDVYVTRLDEAERDLLLQLQIGVGVHTGWITVWAITHETSILYTALEETTHLAVQLAHHTEPGTTLMSEATAQRLRGEAQLQVGQSVLLPHTTTSVMTYSVVRTVLGFPPLMRWRDLDLSPFVGREREQAMLHDALTQLHDRRGLVIGIAGEAGLGKSRLVYEFRHQLQGMQVSYLVGYCRAYGTAMPYLPVLDILRQYFSITVDDTHETLCEKIDYGLAAAELNPAEKSPYLLQLFGVKSAIEALAGRSPESIKAGTIATIRQLILNCCQRQPLVLVVEDLHWSDRLSEAVWTSLADTLAGVPILLLMTYRLGYQPSWITKSYASQITMRPLSTPHSVELVKAVPGMTQCPDVAIQAIIAKAEGNPFFLEELTQVVLEHADTPLCMPIPNTIQEVILARIDRLPAAAKRLLQTAAVIGRDGPIRLLETVWNSAEEVEPLLQDLQRLEFLYEQPGTNEVVYVFKHALTQEVAYDNIPLPRRQTLHQAVGLALETLYAGRLEEVYDRLAYHYARTPKASKAIPYLIHFAEQATQQYAHAEAAQALQEALQHVERLPKTQWEHHRVDIILRLAQAFSFLGRLTETLDLLLPQRESLERLQQPVLAGPYYFRLGRTYSLLGNQAQAVQQTRRALEEAQHCNDIVTMGKAHYDLARELFLSDLPKQGLEHGQQAIALLERTGEWWWLGLTYWIVGTLHGLLGEFTPALEANIQAQTIGAALNDLHVQSYAAFSTGWIETRRGECAAGIAAAQQSLKWALDPVNVTHATGALGFAYLEQGEVAKATSLLEQAVQQWKQFGMRSMQAWMMAYLAEA